MHTLILLLCLLPSSVPTVDDADDAYQFVAGLCEQGHHAMAIREARKFLEAYPRHVKADLARYRLASALFEVGEAGEAAPHYRTLTGREGFEYRAESWLRLGECELRENRPKQAKVALRQALASDQAYLHPAAAFFLGESHFTLTEYAPARERYDETLRAEGAAEYHPHALRGLAWCDFYLGAHAAAARGARAFLKRHADHALRDEVRFLLGDAEREGGSPARAEAAWKKIEAGEFHDAALRGRAFARSSAGDLVGAARLFGELLQRYPKGRFAAEAALQRGAHLLRAGRGAEALEALSSPIAGTGPEVLYWLGKAQAECGNEEQALRTLERAAREAPAELAEQIAAARGDVLFALGRLEESADAYLRSRSDDYALHAAATAQLNAGNEERAVGLARELLERYPESPYATTTRLALAEGLFALGEHDEAREEFTSLLRRPDELPGEDRARAQARIGWCHYLTGNRVAALTAFAAVSERHPRSVEAEPARYMEGRSALEVGEAERAVAAWTRYLAEHPGGAHLAEVQLELSRLQPGTDHLEELLKNRSDDPLAPQALFELAEKLADSGAREQAIARYRELLEHFPRSEPVLTARYGLAWQLREAGEPGPALEQLGLLLRAKPAPELRRAALQLSIWCAAEAGETDACLDAWTAFEPLCTDEGERFAAVQVTARALESAGRHASAQKLLADFSRELESGVIAARARVEGAWLALDAGEIEVAERRVAEALRLEPESVEALQAAFFVGEAHFAAGEAERAEGFYRAATAPHAGELRDDALYKLGFSRLRLERWKGAAEAFEQLVADFPRSELFGEGLFLAGECRFRSGELERSVELLDRVRVELPRHEVRAKGLFRLGLAQFELGAFKACERVLTELCKKHAKFENRAEAELCRGRALAALEKPRAARSAFDSVLRLDRGALAARARLEIGRLHYAAGQHDDALSEFLKVALLYAHEAEVAEATLLAGHCLQAQGQRELAIEQYQRLVEKYPKSPFAAEAKKRLKTLRIR